MHEKWAEMYKCFQGRSIFVFLVILGLLSCARISNLGTIEVKDSKIGFELQDDGHVIGTHEIPADVSKIYLETFVDIPDTSEITLEYKWYYEDQFLYSNTGRHSRGYVIATLEIDPIHTPSLPEGNYAVQVWFLNTMVDEVLFTVQD